MKGDSQPIDARTWMTTEEMQPYEKAEERAENPPPSIRHQAQCLLMQSAVFWWGMLIVMAPL